MPAHSCAPAKTSTHSDTQLKKKKKKEGKSWRRERKRISFEMIGTFIVKISRTNMNKYEVGIQKKYI